MIIKYFLGLSIIILFLNFNLVAQNVPQGLNYQAIARDANGNELINQILQIQFSILSNNPNGSIEWQEIHTDTTNEFGLYELIIGQGISTGSGGQSSFSDINWGDSKHFLKIEIDIGAGFLNMGTIQFLSVPYALYAEKAIFGKDADYDTTNELQNLYINDKELSISDGNSIMLPPNIFKNFDFPFGIPNLYTKSNDTLKIPENKILFSLGDYGQVYFGELILSEKLFQSTSHLGYFILTDSILHISSAILYALIDKNPDFEPIIKGLNQSDNRTYIIPDNKIFILKSISQINSSFNILIGGYGSDMPLELPYIIGPGSTLQLNSSLNTIVYITGYLVSLDFFNQ